MSRIRQHIKNVGAKPLSEIHDNCIETVLLREDDLKNEILKMTNHIDKWIDEAQGFNNKVNVKRCLQNAINGTIRIKELLKES